MHFDYSSLNQRTTMPEKMALLRQKSRLYRGGFWFACIVGISLLLLIPLLILLSGDVPPEVLTTMCVSGVLSSAVAPCIVIYVLYLLGQEILMARFAEANGIKYYKGPLQAPRDGMIFNEGHAQRFSTLFELTGKSVSEIGNFEYTTGSGRSQEVHRYEYIRMKLPRNLPNIILDSRSNNGVLGLARLPVYLETAQELELEGDFNKYFKLYAPTGYATDALYIFTPDVMQLMIAATAKYDSEIIDDNLYMFTKGAFNFHNNTKIEELMNIADLIHSKLTSQTQRYTDERMGGAAVNTVAPQGQKLTTHVPWWIIVLGILFVALDILASISKYR